MRLNQAFRPGWRHWALACGVAPMALFAWLAWFHLGRPTPPVTLEKVVIALPTPPAVGPLFIAFERGLFRQQGLDAVHQRHVLGLQGLNAVLEGKADLVLVADTPFMFAVMRGEKIAIIATVSSSRHAVALVARKDRGISKPEDLAGKTIGTTVGTNLQFFLDAMLAAHSVPDSAVKIVNLQPEEFLPALRSGKVDAVSAWNPYLSALQKNLGEQVVALYGEELFSYRFNLVGRMDYIAAHPATVRKVLVAVAQANRFIRSDEAQARRIIGSFVAMDQATLKQSFDPNDFELRLDQSLVLALDDQSRWAIKDGLVATRAVPNYLDYIYIAALESIRPEAITLIH